MNTGGKNGSCTITTTSGGTTVAVTYPEIPGDPPTPAHTDIFETVVDPWLRRFENSTRVDVVVDENGGLVSVTGHK